MDPTVHEEKLIIGYHKDEEPLFFNIYINDLFMFVTDCMICDYVDDTTTYVSDYKHPDIWLLVPK